MQHYPFKSDPNLGSAQHSGAIFVEMVAQQPSPSSATSISPATGEQPNQQQNVPIIENGKGEEPQEMSKNKNNQQIGPRKLVNINLIGLGQKLIFDKFPFLERSPSKSK